MKDEISEIVNSKITKLKETRRFFHNIPELGFKEFKTSKEIMSRLEKFGLEVEYGIGKTGVVGKLVGKYDGPTLMIRADIDGLPIDENTDLDFSSNNGNMHACGHDGHITMALGAAEILSKLKSNLYGNIVFVFQPAEEIVQGALAMIKDGLFEKYPADRVIGTHLWNQVPCGKVGINDSTVFAGADQFRITVQGKGGHGAMPHIAVDPIITLSQIINMSQTIVSREIAPNEMSVLTFGQVHGGSAPNVIADSVIVEGTIRSYRNDVQKNIMDSLKRISKNVADATRAIINFERIHGAPPVINNPKVANSVARVSSLIVGEENATSIEPISVGDDMAEFLNRVPGTYFILGAGFKDAESRGIESHHNSKFDYDENCLPIGTEIFVRSALDYLS